MVGKDGDMAVHCDGHSHIHAIRILQELLQPCEELR